jgi:hypothetical protein
MINLYRFLTLSIILISQIYCASASHIARTDFETVRYRLGSGGNAPYLPFTATGLSGAEKDITWTDKTRVTFTIPNTLGDKRASRITFHNVIGHVNQFYSQEVGIFVNNVMTQSLQFSNDSNVRTIDIPLPNDSTQPTLITFNLPLACRPSVLSPGNRDPRLLGLALGAIDVSFEKGHHAVINMGSDNVFPLKLKEGFAAGENTHRWVTGKRASFTIPFVETGKQIRQISFDTCGFVTANNRHTTQRLIVSGVGIPTQQYFYTKDQPTQRVVIDLPASFAGPFEVNLSTPDALMPRMLDPTNFDARELSVAFQTADIVYFDSPINWIRNVSLNNLNYHSPNHLAIIGADKLHTFTQGEGSKVIVIDDGVDVNHNDLRNNLTAATRLKVFNNKIDHGTHVSGIIKSIAPQAQLEVISPLLCKGLKGALRAAAKCTGDVVNMSLGFGCVQGDNIVIHAPMIDALESVVKTGKVVMLSFGNNFDHDPRLANYGRLYSQCLINMVNNPRLMGRVRLVANLSYQTLNDENLNAESCRAVTACRYAISAPGTNIWSTMPNNQQGLKSGTSMAVPMMSGLYALLKSALPHLSQDQCLQLIDCSARKYSRSGVKLDDTYGVGVADVYEAFQQYHISIQQRMRLRNLTLS